MMIGPKTDQASRWLAARNPHLLILAAITLAVLASRWLLAVGYALGDDSPYTDMIHGILEGAYPAIGSIGQYEYRPMWLLPLAASVRLLGWTEHGLVLYPLVTGSLVPLLSALWLRRHLPAGSKAPLLCAVILAVYPTIFVDSLMLVNEMPMIFWCLLCVNLFGLTYARLVDCRPGLAGLFSWIALSFLAGIAFASAYQVKVTAVPILGLWLIGEFALQLNCLGWPKVQPKRQIALAGLAFLVPAFGLQTFYFVKIGHPLGNFIGEFRFYDGCLPSEYFQGKLRFDGIFMAYVQHLFLPFGDKGYQSVLHGAWAWIGVGSALALACFWRRLPRQERTVAMVFFASTVAVFLFLEFWPVRLKPYYVPNCYSGRPWRYMDVMAPGIAAWTAVVLTLPEISLRPKLSALRIGVVSAGLFVAGYCLVVRYFEFEDRSSDFRRVRTDCATILDPYRELLQIIDLDGCGQLRFSLGWPRHPEVRANLSDLLDLRRSPAACVWTGGARRESLDGDIAWSPDRIRFLGRELVLIHTWEALRQPWRHHPLQLWLYRPFPPFAHEPGNGH
jgi:hypothetical protein